jgi:hypothetical protein
MPITHSLDLRNVEALVFGVEPTGTNIFSGVSLPLAFRQLTLDSFALFDLIFDDIIKVDLLSLEGIIIARVALEDGFFFQEYLMLALSVAFSGGSMLLLDL